MFWHQRCVARGLGCRQRTRQHSAAISRAIERACAGASIKAASSDRHNKTNGGAHGSGSPLRQAARCSAALLPRALRKTSRRRRWRNYRRSAPPLYNHRCISSRRHLAILSNQRGIAWRKAKTMARQQHRALMARHGARVARGISGMKSALAWRQSINQ